MNLDNYETVAERIEKWWVKYLEIGRIDTEIVYQDGNRYIVKANGYREITDLVPAATGLCEEIRSSTNRHPLENAETGAIGRMLHNAGISKFSDGIPRPSLEEMRSVENRIRVVPDDVTGSNDPWSFAPVVEIGSAVAAVPNAPMRCSHGEMSYKTGISPKDGKAYAGWVCSAKQRADQCKAIWI